MDEQAVIFSVVFYAKYQLVGDVMKLTISSTFLQVSSVFSSLIEEDFCSKIPINRSSRPKFGVSRRCY